VTAWGEHREGLVETHDRRSELSRYVEESTAYGRSWNGTRLDNGTFRIEPEDATGARVEDPRWCRQAFCLFTSRVANVTDAALVVEHEPTRGDSVHVQRLDTHLTVTSVA
jgi:hypothetical protein